MRSCFLYIFFFECVPNSYCVNTSHVLRGPMSFNMAHRNIRKHLLRKIMFGGSEDHLPGKIFQDVWIVFAWTYHAASCFHLIQLLLEFIFSWLVNLPHNVPPHRKKALWSRLSSWFPLIPISPLKSLDVYFYVFILSVLIQGTLSAKDQQTGIDLPKTVKICCFLSFPTCVYVGLKRILCRSMDRPFP